MKLTEEQLQIINSSGDIKINAVAGSGKTTTLIEYVKARELQSQKFLYLAFNSSVRKNVSAKFQELGYKNVRVETAHSLAYKHIVRKNNFSIAANYKLTDIISILELKHRDASVLFLMAGHIKKFTSWYCNTSASKVQELDYLSIVSDPMAKAFVAQYYDTIQYQTRMFLTKMLRGEISVTHDFYLKLFQLENPQLKYDYILFDEGQDASPCMLDVFMRQNSRRIIVGDTNQQIYRWRYAVNSLEAVNGFQEYNLNSSFRLDNELARVASNIIGWKSNIDMPGADIRIKGLGRKNSVSTRATIARTNLRLLASAIEKTSGYFAFRKIYFEGNINSYTYAGEGASLYDVLNLQMGNYHLIRDEMIKDMKDISELKDYAEKSEESELGMLIDIVEEYGEELPGYIKLLKEKHVSDSEREKADMIFSTAHRCKGMEYDEVTIEKDFISEDMVLRQNKSEKKEKAEIEALNEEINMLYVAVTRARFSLRIPEELTDKDSREIVLNSRNHTLIISDKAKNTRNYARFSMKKERKAESLWNDELDRQLEDKLSKKTPLKFIAKQMEVPRKEVVKRIRDLELYNRYDIYY